MVEPGLDEGVDSGELQITPALIDRLVLDGGYVHPLFRTSPDPTASDAPDSVPLPGAGVLLLMGGLAESSGGMEGAAVLLGFEDVRFRKMLRAGGRLRVQVTPGRREATRGGNVIQRFAWTGRNGDVTVAELTAVMLMTSNEGD